MFICKFSHLWSFRLCYVQSLAGHKSPVTAVSASETTGDIATVCDSGKLAPNPKHGVVVLMCAQPAGYIIG